MKKAMYFNLLFSIVFTFMFCEYINAQTQTADYYNVNTGEGKGLRLWNSDKYKIHMGNTDKYHYGPVTDYSIKTNMNNDAARGWTWGVFDKVPIAALNTQGNFQIKGWMKIATSRDATGAAGSGGLEIGDDNGDLLRIDNNEIITNTNTLLHLQRDNNGDVSFDTNTLRVDASTDRIGIGFSAPQTKLEVKGTVRATSATTRNNRTEIGHTGNHGFINTYGAGDLLFRHHGSTLMRLRDNGQIDIHGTRDATGEAGTGLLEIGDALRIDNNEIITNTNTTLYLQRDNNGKINIGNVSNTSNNYKLFVEKGILTEQVKVAVKTTSDWSDYVFEEDYEVMPIDELENYIMKNKRLPNVPSAEEMVKSGLDVATMDAKLLEKIEEAYLYIIQLENRIKTLEGHSK